MTEPRYTKEAADLLRDYAEHLDTSGYADSKKRLDMCRAYLESLKRDEPKYCECKTHPAVSLKGFVMYCDECGCRIKAASLDPPNQCAAHIASAKAARDSWEPPSAEPKERTCEEILDYAMCLTPENRPDLMAARAQVASLRAERDELSARVMHVDAEATRIAAERDELARRIEKAMRYCGVSVWPSLRDILEGK